MSDATPLRQTRGDAQGQTANRVLIAATAVFTRLGYANSTIGDIALEAGATRPTVYAYFSSKEEIFRTLANRVQDEFLAIQAIPEDLPPEDILRIGDLGTLDISTANAKILTIIQHQSLCDPAMNGLWDGIYSRINRRHIRFMRNLVAAGLADPVASLDSIAFAMTGIVRNYSQILAEDLSLYEHLSADLIEIHRAMLRFSTVDGRSNQVTNRTFS